MVASSEPSMVEDQVAIRVAAARYEAILGSALDAMVMIDQEGRVIEFNPAAELLFGYRRADLLGQPMEEYIVPERLRHAHTGGIARFLATGEGPALNRRLEVPALRADGSELIIELIAVPVRIEGRYEFAAFIRDMTEVREAHEQVIRSEERFRTLIDRAPQVISIVTTDGAWVSSSGSTFLGHPPGYDPPGGFFSLLHPDDQERAHREFAEVVAGLRRADQSSDYRVRNAAGEYRICAVTGEDLTSNPAVAGVVLRAWDVTEERARQAELHAALGQLRTVLDSLPMAVLLEDDRGRLAMVNQEFATLMDWDEPLDELVGLDLTQQSLWPVHKFADSEEVDRRSRELHRRRARGTDVVRTVAGRVLRRECVPIESSGAYLGLLWMHRDITDEFNYTEALAAQNRSLAELARLKNEFVATVSHELRTPLTSVISYAGLLREPDVGTLNDEQSGLLEVIDRNANRLLRLIGDLLLLAKLESNTVPVELESLDLPSLLYEVLAEAGSAAELGGVELVAELSDGPRLAGDAVRLAQVFGNLVGNAVKFTPSGGKVVVRASAGRTGWVVSIMDTGIGIPAEEQHRVFTSFYRGSNTRERNAPGTGLGLAISKVIVDLHGGTIDLESVEGTGTTVTVSLPHGRPGESE